MPPRGYAPSSRPATASPARSRAARGQPRGPGDPRGILRGVRAGAQPDARSPRRAGIGRAAGTGQGVSRAQPSSLTWLPSRQPVPVEAPEPSAVGVVPPQPRLDPVSVGAVVVDHQVVVVVTPAGRTRAVVDELRRAAAVTRVQPASAASCRRRQVRHSGRATCLYLWTRHPMSCGDRRRTENGGTRPTAPGRPARSCPGAPDPPRPPGAARARRRARRPRRGCCGPWG